MNTALLDQPKSRLWTANYTRAWVANSTVAVDSRPFSRRAEGIGYYGLSNNVALALAPSVGLALFGAWVDFDLLMRVGVALALVGVGG